MARRTTRAFRLYDDMSNDALEPEASTHRRVVAVVHRASTVPGWPEVAVIGDVGGEPNRVVDASLLHLTPPQQPRQDRQTCGVR